MVPKSVLDWRWKSCGDDCAEEDDGADSLESGDLTSHICRVSPRAVTRWERSKPREVGYDEDEEEGDERKQATA